MRPLTAAELGEVLGAADAETVAGFVADLEAARGRRVERREGPAFVVGTDGDRERVVVPTDGDDLLDGDAVVVAGRDVDAGALDGPRPLDADDLAEALLYAVDRSTAEDLLQRWFGRSLDSFEGAANAAGTADARSMAGARPADHHRGTGGAAGWSSRDAGAASARTSAAAATGAGQGGEPPTDDGDVPDGDGGDAAGVGAPLSDWSPGLRVAAVVLVALAVSLAGVWAVATPASPDGTEPTVTPTAAGDDPGIDTRAGDDFETRSKVGSEESTQVSPGQPGLPPGVSPSGEIDEAQLLDAHEAVLANSTYRVTVTYREFVDGTETGTYVQTVRVGEETTYRVTETRLGRFEEGPVTLTRDASGHPGTSMYASGGDVAEDRVLGRDPVLGEMVRFMGYYLSVEHSRVADTKTEDGSTTVRLTMRDDPWPGVENTTGSAVVEQSGLVRQVRRAHDVPDSPVHVVVTIRVSDVGRTNVTVSTPTPGE